MCELLAVAIQARAHLCDHLRDRELLLGREGDEPSDLPIEIRLLVRAGDTCVERDAMRLLLAELIDQNRPRWQLPSLGRKDASPKPAVGRLVVDTLFPRPIR